MVSGDEAKQTLHFDLSGSPTIMTHGNFDGGLDADEARVFLLGQARFPALSLQ
jgi:hypothetical protein